MSVFWKRLEYINKIYYNSEVKATLDSRSDNKNLVIERVVQMVNSALELSDEFVLSDRGYEKIKK